MFSGHLLWPKHCAKYTKYACHLKYAKFGQIHTSILLI